MISRWTGRSFCCCCPTDSSCDCDCDCERLLPLSVAAAWEENWSVRVNVVVVVRVVDRAAAGVGVRQRVTGGDTRGRATDTLCSRMDTDSVLLAIPAAVDADADDDADVDISPLHVLVTATLHRPALIKRDLCIVCTKTI